MSMRSEQSAEQDEKEQGKNQSAIVGTKEGILSMFAQAICANDYSLSTTLTFVLFNTVSFVQLEHGANPFTLLFSIPQSFGELVCFQGISSFDHHISLQHFMHIYSSRAVSLVKELNHASKGVVSLESYSTPLLHEVPFILSKFLVL